MSKSTDKLKKPIVSLEDAKAQISRGWLEVEREKTIFASALDNLQVGFIIIDDYRNITFRNISFDSILGPIDDGGWTISKMEQVFKGQYNFKEDIDNCFDKRIQIGPRDVFLGNKPIRIFLAPITILKKSLAVPDISIIVEDIAKDKINSQKLSKK